MPTLANIKGDTVHKMGKDKEQYEIPFTSQLTDPKLREHIMVKEECSELMFDKVDWGALKTAFKRLSKNRQMTVSKSCHNLWHTGKRKGCIYREKKSCCFCHTEEEDWNLGTEGLMGKSQKGYGSIFFSWGSVEFEMLRKRKFATSPHNNTQHDDLIIRLDNHRFRQPS
jgi:hypothetical protein